MKDLEKYKEAAKAAIDKMSEEDIKMLFPDIKKGYTWEDSFDTYGCYISEDSDIFHTRKSATEDNKRLFKTEAHAKSALAAAQLSHIVAKYNEGNDRIVVNYAVVPVGGKNFDVLPLHENDKCYHFKFKDVKDAFTSMEVNRQLWLDYWMVS